MKHSINSWPTKASLGMLCLLGSSTLLIQPTVAASSSLTGATIGGFNPDFDLICATGAPQNSLSICSGGETLADVLVGNSTTPGGNVELQANSETNNPPFNFATDFTTLEGTINGNSFFARSLIASDWTSTFTQAWLTQAFSENGLNISLFPGGAAGAEVAFRANNGPQRFSDPNISYVFEDNGFLNVGLAGLLNARDLLVASLPPAFAPFVPPVVQVSELVYIEYRDIAGIFYSFDPTNAGQSANDGNIACPGGAPSGVNDSLAKCSYSGNYQITEPVPEPLTLLGASAAIGFGGLFKRRRSENSRKG